MRRAIAGAVAVLALLPSGALAAPVRASLSDIENEVMCPVCGVPLELADSPQAKDERRFIRGLIDRGQTKPQIKDALVREYGRSVLAMPSSKGFNAANWLVPAAVVAALAVLVALLAPRWRRRARTEPAPAAGPELSAAETARIDEDLARFDP